MLWNKFLDLNLKLAHPNMTNEPETERIFKSVIDDPNAFEVHDPNCKISDKPMFSLRYGDCNGVVLLNHAFAGLSHYDLSSIKSGCYLMELIEAMRGFSNSDDLVSIIIGGDENHFRRNEKNLRHHNIPVVGYYLDLWAQGKSLPSGFNEATKDLVVIPNTKEVILYSKPVGYVKLH